MGLLNDQASDDAILEGNVSDFGRSLLQAAQKRQEVGPEPGREVDEAQPASSRRRKASSISFVPRRSRIFGRT